MKRKYHRPKHLSAKRTRSVTRTLFLATQFCALGWVSVSYLIALYATVKLGQVFPVEDLSGQAISAILSVNALKTLANIFEHNNGAVFGSSQTPAPMVDDETEGF